jgi:hypothetical protein
MKSASKTWHLDGGFEGLDLHMRRNENGWRVKSAILATYMRGKGVRGTNLDTGRFVQFACFHLYDITHLAINTP